MDQGAKGERHTDKTHGERERECVCVTLPHELCLLPLIHA